jgi:hypothetical protein
MSWYSRSKLSRLGHQAVAAIVAALVVIGCSVDERLLVRQRLDGGAGRSTSGGGAGIAGTSAQGGSDKVDVSPPGGVNDVAQSGAGGESSGGGSPSGGEPAGLASGGSPSGGERDTIDDYGAGGCGDLDRDAVQDCKETLLSNARFNSDESGWQPEPSIGAMWDPRNARAGQSSGALAVTNGLVYQGEGMTLGGSRQCQPVVGGKRYAVAGRAFVPEGQGEVKAGISITFYGIDDCADYFLSAAPPIIMLSGPEAWGLIQGTVQAPLAAHSAYIRLVTIKPFKQAPTKALFDDVLVREE